MAVQAALGSDIALAFDECTPFHADRDYTARSTERTHRWLDRCLDWHAEHGPGAPGGVRDRPGRRPRGPAPRVGRGGRLRRRRRARDRRHARPRQAGDARGARADRAACCRPTRPSTCSGSASPTTCSPGSRSASTSSTAPCRPGSPATGWRSRRCPQLALSLRRRPSPTTRPTRGRSSRAARARPAPPHAAPTCTTSPRAEPPTAARLLTLHNLTFLERLVAGAAGRDRGRRLRALPRRDARRSGALGAIAGQPRD